MTKETLTLDNIKKDLHVISADRRKNLADRYDSYTIPVTVLAILIGFLLRNIWLGLAIFSVAVVSFVMHQKALKPIKEGEKELARALENGNIAISVEQFSHIYTETVQEYKAPAFRGAKSRFLKEIEVFCFASGTTWRIPKVDRHYKWSKELYQSTKGLENISVPGNEFYYITLQGHPDLAYIYPCKLFQLGNLLDK